MGAWAVEEGWDGVAQSTPGCWYVCGGACGGCGAFAAGLLVSMLLLLQSRWLVRSYTPCQECCVHRINLKYIVVSNEYWMV